MIKITGNVGIYGREIIRMYIEALPPGVTRLNLKKVYGDIVQPNRLGQTDVFQGIVICDCPYARGKGCAGNNNTSEMRVGSVRIPRCGLSRIRAEMSTWGYDFGNGGSIQSTDKVGGSVMCGADKDKIEKTFRLRG